MKRIELGFGLVGVLPGSVEGVPSLIFTNTGDGVVGSENSKHGTVEQPGEVDAHHELVSLVFHSPESVDIVIGELVKVKAMLEGARDIPALKEGG